MIPLIFQRYYVAGSRVSEYGSHFCTVNPIMPMKYARLRRYDKTCHNTKKIL